MKFSSLEILKEMLLYHLPEMVLLARLPSGPNGKECTCQCRKYKRHKFNLCIEKNLLEEGMESHFSILARRIQWTEEPGGLQSIGSQRVGHDWNDLAGRDVYVRPTQRIVPVIKQI